MKARLQGKILSVKNGDGDAEITIQATGKVDKSGKGVMAPTARETSMNGTMTFKAVVANEIKIGAVITITVSDEESDERLD
jgi:hypothetical protein